MKYILAVIMLLQWQIIFSQDTTKRILPDSARLQKDSVEVPLRIINLNPYFTLHVDSILQYDFEINKPAERYHWYMKNAPLGVKLDKSTGILYFKADKSYFKSGKLKYDQPYQVNLGVQSLFNPDEKVDTSCTIVFYNTEIIQSRIKPSVNGMLFAEEGDSIKFRVQCEDGTFPIEQITMFTNMPIAQYKSVKSCDEDFIWMIPFDFIRDNDTAKQKTLAISFVGSDKFSNKDTAQVRIQIKPGIDYPRQYLVYQKLATEIDNYVASLKLTFYVLSNTVKKNKSTRTTFDITGSTTALAGTVVATTAQSQQAKDIGKILPSIGLTLVPVKEATAPSKTQEQNMATQVRTVAKRLEYLLSENALIGERDPDVLAKTKKLQEELKQARMQLVDFPLVEFDEKFTREDAEKYFENPKVNKKYRPKMN